jgi:hypothetical protein
MAGIGVFVLWLGYSLAFYGTDQIRGGNNGLLSLMIPGKYVEQPRDSAAAGGGTAVTGGPVSPSPSNPAGVAAVSATSAPAGAPKGTYGVDQNGNIYVKQNGNWVLYTFANQSKPAQSI